MDADDGLFEAGYIDDLFGEGTLDRLRGKGEKIDSETLEQIQNHHNPNDEETGHYTGRCMRCHSDELFAEMVVYGCEVCHAVYSADRVAPRLLMNRGTPETPEVRKHNEFSEAVARQDSARYKP